MLNKEELIFEGFVFSNTDDVELAKNEIKKIDYIKSKVNFKDFAMLKSVYDKAIENKSFSTPIGLAFMHELRDYLIKNGIEENDIQPIPLYTSFRRLSLNNLDKPVRTRVTKAQKEELDLKIKNRNMSIVCAILTVIIIAMFVISFTGTNPTILNYKTAITNQYSAWEQDLRERETIIREKERELKITE